MANPNNIGQKLTFRIVEFSSEDSQYPATELLTGSPQAKGWQSERFCDWPQYLTLEFFSPVRLKQLQFLSHQCKISSKIELFASLPNVRSPAPTSDMQFNKLGYLCLDPNEKSGYQSRELKTVYVDAVCAFLKVVLHKCYLNKFNLFNQVGLIAIGVFGEPMSSASIPKQLDSEKGVYDRVDETQFDPITLIRIKELEEVKNIAVEKEDFEEAKKLKQAIARMKHIGAQLKYLEESKKKAIQNEDFDSAKIINQEILRLRESVAPYTLGRQYIKEKPEPRVKFVEEKPISPETTNVPQKKSEPVQEEQKQTPIKPKKSGNHDDQVIPAVMNKNPAEDANPFPKVSGGSDEAEPLTLQTQKLAEPLIPIIGEELARQIFSKTWNYREEGLKTLEGDITGKPKIILKKDPISIFTACMGVVSHTINDKVSQVVVSSINLLQAIISKDPPNLTPKTELAGYIDNIVSGLLEKIGDNNTRVRELAEVALISMAYNPVVTCSLCVNALVKNVNPTKHKTAGSTRHTVGRLFVLSELVKGFGIDNKDVSYQPVVSYAVEKLDNPAIEIRSAASNLLVEIYRLVGESLKADLEGVRPNQLDLLLKEFDAVGTVGFRMRPKVEEKKPIVTTNINPQGKKGAVKGKGAKDSKQSKAPQSGEADVPGVVCEFCGVKDRNFGDNRIMNVHLWRECPMLVLCEICGQIVEIPQLNQHLLEECTNKSIMRKCPRCKEAVHVEEYKQHTEEMSCLQSQQPTKANRCPLCHQDIPPGDMGWKQHILVEGCPNNERTL